MPGVRITPVDIDCFQEIGELGLLDTATIQRRHYRDYSLRGVQNRLQLFDENGFTRIARLAVSFQHAPAKRGKSGRNRGGALPTLHGLTDLGGDTVERATGVCPLRVFPKDPAPVTLYHRWRGTQVRLAMDDAVALHSLAPARWIMEQDMQPEMAKGTPPNQCRVLYHAYRTGGKTVTCQPDQVSLMSIPGPEGKSTPLLGLWENDLSSEGHKQICAKLPGYALYVQEKSWNRYFPELEQAQSLPIRVFWTCPNSKRCAELGKAVADEPISRLFRFVDFPSLTAKSALVAPIWQTTSGDRRAILGR